MIIIFYTLGAFCQSEFMGHPKQKNGYNRQQATETIETFLELIKKSLASGEDVLVSGFGKFCVKQKKERRGRNPATGGDMTLAPRKVVTFKCSGKLRDKINGGG